MSDVPTLELTIGLYTRKEKNDDVLECVFVIAANGVPPLSVVHSPNSKPFCLVKTSSLTLTPQTEQQCMVVRVVVVPFAENTNTLDFSVHDLKHLHIRSGMLVVKQVPAHFTLMFCNLSDAHPHLLTGPKSELTLHQGLIP